MKIYHSLICHIIKVIVSFLNSSIAALSLFFYRKRVHTSVCDAFFKYCKREQPHFDIAAEFIPYGNISAKK